MRWITMGTVADEGENFAHYQAGHGQVANVTEQGTS